MPQFSPRLLLFLVAFVAFSGCASPSNKSEPHWTKSSVVGLSMSLNDPVRIEEYSFIGNGRVIAEYGKKNGWVTAPVELWRIQSGLLQILDDDKIVTQELRLIGQDSKTITAINRQGKTVRYTIRRER